MGHILISNKQFQGRYLNYFNTGRKRDIGYNDLMANIARFNISQGGERERGAERGGQMQFME